MRKQQQLSAFRSLEQKQIIRLRLNNLVNPGLQEKCNCYSLIFTIHNIHDYYYFFFFQKRGGLFA